MRALWLCLAATSLWAGGPGVMESHYAAADFELSADPSSPAWRGIAPVIAETDPFGNPVPGHRTEIRSRWTDRSLYFLFVCPYRTLHLKPGPRTDVETNRLWNFDVAEVFLGSDFQNITRYKEFEMSPQGEWVDLDIDRLHPLPEGGWRWDSGFTVKARLDKTHSVWYGEMRIPFAGIDPRPPANARELRVNLYRCQGSDPDRKYICWQPTRSRSFHVPESFGLLRLVGR